MLKIKMEKPKIVTLYKIKELRRAHNVMSPGCYAQLMNH